MHREPSFSVFAAPGSPAATGDATKARSGGELQTFEVTNRALAGRTVECITAMVTDPADASAIYDRAGPFTFKPFPDLEAKLGRTPPRLTPGEPARRG